MSSGPGDLDEFTFCSSFIKYGEFSIIHKCFLHTDTEIWHLGYILKHLNVINVRARQQWQRQKFIWGL